MRQGRELSCVVCRPGFARPPNRRRDLPPDVPAEQLRQDPSLYERESSAVRRDERERRVPSHNLMGPVMPQMSTTSRPSSSSSRYARWGAPTTITSESCSTFSSGSKVGSGTYGSLQSTFAPLNCASLRSL